MSSDADGEQAELSAASVPPVAASMWRYLLVGGSTALLEIVVFQGLFALSGHNVLLANPVAVVVATALNFALNRSWTFGSRGHVGRSLLLYALLFLFNMTFSTTVIAALVGVGVISVAAKILTMVCITLWNFVLYRKVIFR